MNSHNHPPTPIPIPVPLPSPQAVIVEIPLDSDPPPLREGLGAGSPEPREGAGQILLLARPHEEESSALPTLADPLMAEGQLTCTTETYIEVSRTLTRKFFFSFLFTDV